MKHATGNTSFSSISELHRTMIVHEDLARVFLHVHGESIPAAEFIAAGGWRLEPLAAVTYWPAYSEFLKTLPEKVEVQGPAEKKVFSTFIEELLAGGEETPAVIDVAVMLLAGLYRDLTTAWTAAGFLGVTA